MGKIKDKKLRAYSSRFPSFIKDISKAQYLDYLDRTSDKPASYLVADADGMLHSCYSDGLDANARWDDITKRVKILNDILDGENDYTYNEYDLFNDFKRLTHNTQKKVSRIKKLIEHLLWADCTFLTLTFSDAFMKSHNQNTRRTYIRNYLNSLGCKYIANIDFGDINEREHYHAIVQRVDIDYSEYRKKFRSRINGEKIVYQDADALKRYIFKLTNHAIKPSTQNARILTNISDCTKLC